MEVQPRVSPAVAPRTLQSARSHGFVLQRHTRLKNLREMILSGKLSGHLVRFTSYSQPKSLGGPKSSVRGLDFDEFEHEGWTSESQNES